MILGSLHFSHTYDLTAIGTLALALATFMSLFFARRALKQAQAQIELGQEQLKQTQVEIALSRAEVQEAHRPVIVPFQKAGEGVMFRGGQISGGSGPEATENKVRPGLPQYSAAFLAVENVGMGPALNIGGEFEGPRGLGTTRFPTEAVAVGARGVVVFENWSGGSLTYTGDDSSVSAVIEYEDVAGRKHRTNIVFDIGHNAYTSTFGDEGQLPEPAG